MPKRPELLFISPVWPHEDGRGLAKRAYATLTALTRHYRPSLLVIDSLFYRVEPGLPAPPGVDDRIHIVRSERRREFHLRLNAKIARDLPGFYSWLWRKPADWSDHRPDRKQCAARAFAGQDFACIHALRLPTAPFALAVARTAGPGTRLHLDLDDLESVTHARLATLRVPDGNKSETARLRTAARAYAREERHLLPRFDRIYACSAVDARRLSGQRADLRILPNTAPRYGLLPPPPRANGTVRLLFIGTLDYCANIDALHWLCAEILPRLRQLRDCRLSVAGLNFSEELRRFLCAQPGVDFLGRVERAETAYLEADMLIAPLRAGGGTRIKILESFALGRPVISTTIGIEGIEARPGEHFLLADSTEACVQAALRVIDEPGLGARLTRAARRLVDERYTVAALEPTLAPDP